MKKILSYQMDYVSGGWNDRDGSGKRSSSNGGFGAANTGHSGSDRSLQSFLSLYSIKGSGSGASGIWGSNYSENYGDGNYGLNRSSRMNGRY
ncbi:hypothetical protein AAHB66_00135 [Leclercia sp. S52]|uniref:hypothetical protein n=1 Tax=Leclercia sp. S52 TaxID=3138178 RepID=UPI003219B426